MYWQPGRAHTTGVCSRESGGQTQPDSGKQPRLELSPCQVLGVAGACCPLQPPQKKQRRSGKSRLDAAPPRDGAGQQQLGKDLILCGALTWKFLVPQKALSTAPDVIEQNGLRPLAKKRLQSTRQGTFLPPPAKPAVLAGCKSPTEKEKATWRF